MANSQGIQKLFSHFFPYIFFFICATSFHGKRRQEELSPCHKTQLIKKITAPGGQPTQPTETAKDLQRKDDDAASEQSNNINAAL